MSGGLNLASPAASWHHRRMRYLRYLFVALLATHALAAAQARADGLAPLTDEQRALLAGIREDPKPKELNRNSHYWVSDERRHDLFREDITDLGGTLVGVGTDQLYVMAGWSRPALLIPMDFDQAIVDLHRVYRLLFREAADIDAFLKLWAEKRSEHVMSLIDGGVADQADRKRARKAFRSARALVWARLQRVMRKQKKLGVASFLNDAAQYNYLRDLALKDRIHPVRGDLTGPRTMSDIAGATRSLGEPVRVLYISNAEQYFKWGDGYRRNIKNMSYDDRSQVLRTVRLGEKGSVDGRYHYMSQGGTDFAGWMDVAGMQRLRMVYYRIRTNKKGFWRLPGPDARKGAK